MKLSELQSFLVQNQGINQRRKEDWRTVQEQLHETNNKIKLLGSLNRLTARDKIKLTQLNTTKTTLEQKAKLLKEQLDGNKKDFRNRFADMWRGTNPVQLIGELTDDVPFMLLPVRIETHFHFTPSIKELWVRIYPDSLFHHGHQYSLTEMEYEFGIRYWNEVWNTRQLVQPDEANQIRIDQWNALVKKFEINRSAWIVRQTRPLQWSLSWKNLTSLEFPAYEPESISSFAPEQDTLLPSHFVVEAYDLQDRLLFQKTGAPIPPDLTLGPDVNSGESTFERDSNQNLNITEDLKWMFDFEAAVKVGMGIKIRVTLPITEEFSIPKLVVLGIKLHTTAMESQVLLNSWITNHNYSPDGFSILPQGSATNNPDSREIENIKSTDRRLESLEDHDYFSVTADHSLKSDGQRVAEALGISHTAFKKIPGSDHMDIAESIAFNTALWPATMGLYLDEIMNPLVSAKNQKITYKHFIDFISGRGVLPAIQIGSQPYGLLITSSLKMWSHTQTESGSDLKYWMDLLSTLRQLNAEWLQLLPQVPYVGKAGDPHAAFLEIIGLLPSSVAFHSRKAVTDLYAWNYLSLKNKSDANAWTRMQRALQERLKGLGIDLTKEIVLEKLLFLAEVDEINGPIIDQDPELPLSETEGITKYNGIHNYMDWLLTADFESIKAQKFTDQNIAQISPPKALLYQLLRRSYMESFNHGIQDLLIKNRTIDQKDRPVQLKNIEKANEVDKEDYFDLDASKLRLSAGRISLWDYVKKTVTPGLIRHYQGPPELNIVLNTMKSLKQIAALPTARLERLFAEHMDVCSYRLDAWITGLFAKRFDTMHKDASGNYSPKGLYLGAYAYVENVKPDRSAKTIPSATLPTSLRNHPGPIIEYTDNAGYLQTPSLTHAATAAVLRNAHLTHGKENDLWSVNLSSKRIRSAMHILDGVRQGQDLAALLGYQLERDMHDQALGLHKYIYILRDKFPYAANKIEDTKDPQTSQLTEARNVINGYDLLLYTKNNPQLQGIAGLPALNSNERNAILTEVAKLSDTFDALADLSVSESVFQAIRGNTTRAGGMMQAISEGMMPPVPEIIDTPRSGDTITHRVAIHMDTTAVTAHHPAWGTEPTPRSSFSPYLNFWLAQMLPSPEKIQFTVRTPAIQKVFSIRDFDLQPLDLVLLSGDLVGNLSSDLELWLSYYISTKHHFSSFTFDFKSGTGLSISLYELVPLLRSLKNCINQSRPLNAKDFLLPSVAGMHDAPSSYGFEPTAADKNKLGALLQTLQAQIQSLQVALNHNQIQAIRNHLEQIAQYGFIESLLSDDQALIITAHSLIQRISTIKENDLFNSFDTLSIDRQIKLIQDASQVIFNNTLKYLPLFKVSNVNELVPSIAHSADMLGTDRECILEDWLQSQARVRKPMHQLESIVLHHDIYLPKPFLLKPLQLPVVHGEPWIGAGYAESMRNKERVSISLNSVPDDLNKPLTGMMIDEWTEFIPSQKETTGIAFQFNRPNATPPQTILFAVPPSITGHWSWATISGIIIDTMQRAKIRAVEPDMLSQTNYFQVLPAVIQDFSSGGRVLSTDLLNGSKLQST